jgi:hypothetical protein
MSEDRVCSHGKPLYGNPAPECDGCSLIWYRETLLDAARRVQTSSEQIVKLIDKVLRDKQP